MADEMDGFRSQTGSSAQLAVTADEFQKIASQAPRTVSVIGLGYVGLPVALAFAKQGPVIGYDIDRKRIESLNQGIDQSGEFGRAELSHSNLRFTDQVNALAEANFHIIAVPTPIDSANQPDLSALIAASEIVANILKPGDIVVYESTVYPGATEEICIPRLQRISKLILGKDFAVGYSPERINPGDPEKTFPSISKLVSASDPISLDIIAKTYQQVIDAEVYRVDSIKIAEAAKIIENTQRDLNIALVNELAIIFKHLNLDTAAVLAAANTKWNFLPFKPGLVGGHCIGVDPYYLTYKAKTLGYHPEIISAGRKINDSMGKFIAEQTIKQMLKHGIEMKGATITILGLTFKENCADLRNSKVQDLMNELAQYGAQLQLHDPIADPTVAEQQFALPVIEWNQLKPTQALILAVPHRHYLEISMDELASKLSAPALIIDIKSVLNRHTLANRNIHCWQL